MTQCPGHDTTLTVTEHITVQQLNSTSQYNYSTDRHASGGGHLSRLTPVTRFHIH